MNKKTIFLPFKSFPIVPNGIEEGPGPGTPK
jgi:hypothetical protein